jgi:hypothetical protein
MGQIVAAQGILCQLALKASFAETPKHNRYRLGDLENCFGRDAHRFEPAADIYLGMSFATEMPGGGTIRCSQIPLDDRELLISALDHEPMDWIFTDNPANLALEFPQTRHAFSVERWLDKGLV